MTTEEDFQAALDTDPTDWQTRLVFADWLQDRGDERAEGYRALVKYKTHKTKRVNKYVGAGPANGSPVWVIGDKDNTDKSKCATRIPHDWFDLIPQNFNSDDRWRRFPSRREAEDAAAVAFSQLPRKRRAELLDSVPQGSK